MKITFLILLISFYQSQTVKSQLIESENEVSRSKDDGLQDKIAPVKKTTLRQTAENSTAQVTATRQGPCQCANGLCGCCSRILLSTFRQKACVNVTYDPDDFRFTANILMNDRVLYTRSVSGN